MQTSFRDLRVYQIGLELLTDVEKLVRFLPRTHYSTVDQLRRAAQSIIANIGEGYGKRRYQREFLKYLTNALGSSDEVQVHLDILSVVSSLNRPLCLELQKRYKNLSVRLFNFINFISKSL